MEQVVLLAEDGTPIGVELKSEVHTENTPLHLAFSCYLVNDAGEVLVTRRSLTKKAWPGVWTNSFCGHPAPDEKMEAAISRRASQELGARITDIRVALPDYRYRAVDASGIVENEICPVFVATIDGALSPSADEISEWQWVSPADLGSAVSAARFAFSPWMAEQLPQLLQHKDL